MIETPWAGRWFLWQERIDESGFESASSSVEFVAMRKSWTPWIVPRDDDVDVYLVVDDLSSARGWFAAKSNLQPPIWRRLFETFSQGLQPSDPRRQLKT